MNNYYPDKKLLESVIEITGVKISNLDNDDLLAEISGAAISRKKLLISYANANSVNICFRDSYFKSLLNSSFLTHPDGVGIYIASKFLFPKSPFKFRFSGSDFYLLLSELAIEKGFGFFFFGHDWGTLEKIKSRFPLLIIRGYYEGYRYDPMELIGQINESKADILVVGLGQPLQEKWIIENSSSLSTPVIIAVGDGIKVFAGEKKRGPVFLQKLGLEWLIRLFFNPFKYFHRYTVGIPVFLYRIFRAKLGKLYT